MECPFCGAADTRVVDSRLHEEGTQVRRRRECPGCSRRFTTFERAELSLPMVAKHGATATEPFDESKLRRGFERALYKRPVSPETIDHAVAQVLARARACGERTVPSREVGDWVMEELRELDHVGYVRFASVYRRFADVAEFGEEIARLQSLPSREARRSQYPLIDDSDVAPVELKR